MSSPQGLRSPGQAMLHVVASPEAYSQEWSPRRFLLLKQKLSFLKRFWKVEFLLKVKTLGVIFLFHYCIFHAASAFPGSCWSRKQTRYNTMTNSVLVVPAQKQVLLQLSLGEKIGFSVWEISSSVLLSVTCVVVPLFPFQEPKETIHSCPSSSKLKKAIKDR